jgi:hypothetical protein
VHATRARVIQRADANRERARGRGERQRHRPEASAISREYGISDLPG